MKTARFLGTLILVLIFSGCFDANEPNDFAYVVAIGIDKASDNENYEISIQFAKPAQISGGSSEEGGKGGETLGLITVEAPEIYSGIDIANNLVSKKFQLAHTKLVVISEEIAKTGIKDIVSTVVRSIDLRPNMYIAVAKKGAKKYLEAVEPEMEINPVKYYQLVFESKSAEFIPKNLSQNAYFYINSGERDLTLPLVAPKNDDKERESENSEEEKGDSKSEQEDTELPQSDAITNYDDFEYLIKEYVAGNIVENKKNKSEVMGMAVFAGDKMVAELSGIESEIYNLLNGTFRYSYSAFKSEKGIAVVNLSEYYKPKINVKIADNIPKISIQIDIQGGFVSGPNEYYVEDEIEAFCEKTEKQIKEAVKKFLYKTSRELGTDIVGFGSYSKNNFYTYSDFEKYGWKEAYKGAQFYVEVKFTMDNTGIIIRKGTDNP